MKNKLIIIGAVIIAIVGTIIYWQYQLKTDRSSNNGDAGEQIVQAPAINGVPVPENIAKTRPIALVVENHVSARPQSGLTDADIVYETLAEGGITRFLAVFQTRNPKEIGPVRSARPYFNFIANEWGAAFAHVGGSTIALNELSVDKYKKLQDINQYFTGDYFYRSKDRPAPHNVYTTLGKLRDLMDKEDWQGWTPVKFGEFAVIPTDQLRPTNPNISIKFFEPSYAVGFKYDPTTNTYLRTIGGQPAIDKNNTLQISPKNVLVQYVDDYVVPLEKVNGVGFKLDGSGRAVLFTGGEVRDGTWKYSNSQTEYKTTDGNLLKFQPGPTWIVLMPKSLSANVTW